MNEEKNVLENEAMAETPEQNLKANKKKRNIKWIMVAAVVAAVILLACVSQSATVANAVAKLVMSPQKYYQHVEEDTAETLVKAITSVYTDTIESNTELNQNTKLDVTLNLEDDMIDLLSAITYENLDILKDFGFQVGFNGKDNAMKMSLGLNANGKEFLGGNLILDLKGETLYVQIPQLVKSYLSVNLDDLFEMLAVDMEAADLKAEMEATQEAYKNLPDVKELEKLLNKYIQLALSCIEDVKEEKTTLNINNVSMKCTELTITIDEETVQKMLELVLDTMEKDKELETFITNAAVIMQSEMDGEDLYDEVMEIVSYLSDEIEYISLDDELEMTVWVDKNGVICGRSIEIPMEYNGKIEASYVVAKSGKNLGIELEAEYNGTKLRMDGNAKQKSKKYSGELDVKVAGLKVAKLSFSKVESNKDKFKGEFLLTPQKSIVDLVEDELGSSLPIDLSDLGLKLKADTTAEKGSVEVAVMLEEEALATVTTMVESGKGSSVSLPKEKECIQIEEADDLYDYLEEISIDDLLEDLEDIGIPESILDELYWLLLY